LINVWSVSSFGLLKIKLHKWSSRSPYEGVCFYFFWNKIPRSRMTTSYGKCIFCFRKLPDFSKNGSVILHSHQHFIWSVFKFSHFNSYAVDTLWFWFALMVSIFHVLVCHLCIFLGEECVQIFCSFKKIDSFITEFWELIFCIHDLCQIHDLYFFSLLAFSFFSFQNEICEVMWCSYFWHFPQFSPHSPQKEIVSPCHSLLFLLS
jgi:hypothetical protein